MDLKALEEKYESYQIEMRRHFHRYPEASGEEHDTARKIREELDKMGVEYDPAAKYLGRNGKYIGKPASAVVNCCPTATINAIRE